MSVKPRLQIVEPTLSNQAGHCYHHVYSLAQANREFDIRVWLDSKGAGLLCDLECEGNLFFRRRWRKIQLGSCYAKCLRDGDGIFVPTAGQLDMAWVDILQRLGVGSSKPSTVLFHFHQYRQTPAKLRRLKSWAEWHPDWYILATTERLLELFIRAGFHNCEVAYYPTLPPVCETPDKGVIKEPHLLYAGALRQDKGFTQVVDYLTFLNKRQLDCPALIQCSPPSQKTANEIDPECAAALERLMELNISSVQLIDHTLPLVEYQRMFHNAICLLLYKKEAYHDKFSSVALEALQLGAPIITVADTWMGDVVERYNAGIVVQQITENVIHAAVERVRADYCSFQQRALSAGKELASLHNPMNTLGIISGALKDSKPA